MLQAKIVASGDFYGYTTAIDESPVQASARICRTDGGRGPAGQG